MITAICCRNARPAALGMSARALSSLRCASNGVAQLREAGGQSLAAVPEEAVVGAEPPSEVDAELLEDGWRGGRRQQQRSPQLRPAMLSWDRLVTSRGDSLSGHRFGFAGRCSPWIFLAAGRHGGTALSLFGFTCPEAGALPEVSRHAACPSIG